MRLALTNDSKEIPWNVTLKNFNTWWKKIFQPHWSRISWKKTHASIDGTILTEWAFILSFSIWFVEYNSGWCWQVPLEGNGGLFSRCLLHSVKISPIADTLERYWNNWLEHILRMLINRLPQILQNNKKERAKKWWRD